MFTKAHLGYELVLLDLVVWLVGVGLVRIIFDQSNNYKDIYSASTDSSACVILLHLTTTKINKKICEIIMFLV